MKKIYQIKEYGSFSKGREVKGYISLPNDTFDDLENFILSNSFKYTQTLDIMKLSVQRGVGKIITAQNYVGMITMNDGTVIEILPKIYSKEEENEQKTKKLFIDMLKSFKEFPYKNFQMSNMDISKMSIFEIFIRMFIDEVFYIVKRGIKSDYQRVSENKPFLKGKIDFSKQIKYNLIHKERFFVRYNDYNTNCIENRIIKETLLYLYKFTSSSKNKKDIKILLNNFENVNTLKVYSKDDFDNLVIDRNKKYYERAIMWSEIFLFGKSFTSFSGSKISFALLFPMEKLFEKYIAKQLKLVIDNNKYSISFQDSRYHLFEEPQKKFLIKPDIVLKDKINNYIYVMDTKWKLLSKKFSNYGISQSDIYQMYAYNKKYESRNVTLLYPLTPNIDENKKIRFSSNDGARINVEFIDLYNVKDSLKQIINNMN